MNKKITIVIIRHGERYDSNLFNVCYWSLFGNNIFDPPLTKKGQLNANIFGENLKKFLKINLNLQKFNDFIIYTSPFLRTILTATEIQKSFPNCGIITERAISEYQKYCIHPTAIYESGTIVKKDNLTEFKSRILLFIKSLCKKHQSAFVITHAKCLEVLMDYFTLKDDNLELESDEISFLCCLILEYDWENKKFTKIIKYENK